MNDRTYYRSLTTGKLLLHASEVGINPEMAIAIADELAELVGEIRLSGSFRFNHEEAVK